MLDIKCDLAWVKLMRNHRENSNSYPFFFSRTFLVASSLLYWKYDTNILIFKGFFFKHPRSSLTFKSVVFPCHSLFSPCNHETLQTSVKLYEIRRFRRFWNLGRKTTCTRPVRNSVRSGFFTLKVDVVSRGFCGWSSVVKRKSQVILKV